MPSVLRFRLVLLLLPKWILLNMAIVGENPFRKKKNSAFVSLDDGSVFVRARKIVSAFVTEECDGWHVGVTYERGNTEVYTSYSVDLYPDKEHALAALHDFMERLAAR